MDLASARGPRTNSRGELEKHSPSGEVCHPDCYFSRGQQVHTLIEEGYQPMTLSEFLSTGNQSFRKSTSTGEVKEARNITLAKGVHEVQEICRIAQGRSLKGTKVTIHEELVQGTSPSLLQKEPVGSVDVEGSETPERKQTSSIGKAAGSHIKDSQSPFRRKESRAEMEKKKSGDGKSEERKSGERKSEEMKSGERCLETKSEKDEDRIRVDKRDSSGIENTDSAEKVMTGSDDVFEGSDSEGELELQGKGKEKRKVKGGKKSSTKITRAADLGNTFSQQQEWVVSPDEVVVFKELNRGSSAVVLLGMYRTQMVAVKVIRQVTSKHVENFRKEFEFSQAMKSRYNVYFYGVSLEPSLCLVMEYCERKSLHDVMRDPHMIMQWRHAMKFMYDTVKAVSFLHNWVPSIVHRDIKSMNILVTADWNIKLCDFGLARSTDVSKMTGTLAKVRGTVITALEDYIYEIFYFVHNMYNFLFQSRT